eukprot:scaffold86123_cov32-Tisochrysis_lutea.AAC.3
MVAVPQAGQSDECRGVGVPGAIGAEEDVLTELELPPIEEEGPVDILLHNVAVTSRHVSPLQWPSCAVKESRGKPCTWRRRSRWGGAPVRWRGQVQRPGRARRTAPDGRRTRVAKVHAIQAARDEALHCARPRTTGARQSAYHLKSAHP